MNDFTDIMIPELTHYYSHILDGITVGTYVAWDVNGEYLIHDCNKAFLKMYEFENLEKAKGYNMRLLCEDEKDYENFLKRIYEKYHEGEPLNNHKLSAKTFKKNLFLADVSASILVDGFGKILGRVGVVRDITEESALFQLKNDIGSFLHSYSSMLLLLIHTYRPILKALGPDPWEIQGVKDMYAAVNILIGPSKTIISALSMLEEEANSSEYRRGVFNTEQWTKIGKLENFLLNYTKEIIYPEFIHSGLQMTAVDLIDIINKMNKGRISNEIERDFTRKVQNLARLCCLISVHKAEDEIISMDYEVRALREYINFRDRKLEDIKTVSVPLLITNSLKNLVEFAQNRHVVIRRKDELTVSTHVMVDGRNIERALSNLIHNAIKYSLKRETEPPWIEIRTRVQTANNQLWIEIENYGVPIAKDEIKSGIIFNFGFRGRFSYDSSRYGTGIGLSDAKETARRYGGDVTIESHPANKEADEEDYSKPFITIATLRLPIYKK